MMKTYHFTLALLLMAFTLQAKATLTSFYIDDTPYYHRLYKDGFDVRFRVDQKECGDVLEAQVLVKKHQKTATTSLKELTVRELKTWPELYQIDLEDWDLNGWQARKLPPKVDPESYRVLDKKKKKKKLFGEKIIVDLS